VIFIKLLLFLFDGSGDIRNFIDFFKGSTEGLEGFLTISWIIAADRLSCLPKG